MIESIIKKGKKAKKNMRIKTEENENLLQELIQQLNNLVRNYNFSFQLQFRTSFIKEPRKSREKIMSEIRMVVREIMKSYFEEYNDDILENKEIPINKYSETQIWKLVSIILLIILNKKSFKTIREWKIPIQANKRKTKKELKILTELDNKIKERTNRIRKNVNKLHNMWSKYNLKSLNTS